VNAHGHGATLEGKQRCSITAAEAHPLGDEKGANTQTDTRRQAGDAIAPSRTIVCDEERRAVEDTSGVASPSPVRAGDREAALQEGDV